MPIRLLRLLTVAAMATVLIATSPVDAEQNSADEHTEVPAPALIEESDLTVRISYVGTMPFEVGPGFNQSIIRSNMGSPVAIGDSLYLIDQIDAIYKTNRDGSAPLQKIFDVDEDAPDDGLTLDKQWAVLNMSRGRGNSFYVMHSSSTEPTVSIPIHRLPDPLPGACCDVDNPFFIDDLYRIGEIPGPFDFFGPTSTEWQVLYEYKFLDGRLTRPRAIMAFETQYGPTHNGGAMLTLGNGKILFSPGDGLIQPHAQYGRNDPNGGIAITGAVTSFRSFDEITTMFSDLDSGVPYATTASPLDTDVTVYRVNLVDENDEPVADLNELTEGRRSDPRFFRFPNGKAGVLREGSGSYYMLEELD